MPVEDSRRIRTALNSLAAEQDPQAHVKKLKGHEDVPIYSYRIGDYRAILTFDHGIMVIFVITIDNRRSVYRNV
jgi:mRNA interferase RelE/StbE